MQSKLLSSISGIQHWFGHIGDELGPFSEFWERDRPHWKQVHGSLTRKVETIRESLGECDGLFTRTKNVPIAVVTADCVPILLARRDGSAVAALHAGWKGTLARISSRFFETIPHENPEDWVAAIGPCISKKNYEVGADLSHRFEESFSEFETDLFLDRTEKKLDLVALNILQLKRLGVSETEALSTCTFDDTRFYSYRREKGAGRQLSLIRRC